MKDAKTEATTVILDNNNYKFKATGSILLFDGYLKVYSNYEENNDVILPDFSKYHNNLIDSEEINYTMHTTKPPARYTESKLIKEMETLGIGRPSTYATTVGILSERGYVKIIDKKFHPTEIGIETTDKLQEFFKDIINVDYTRDMEEDLDKIADGNLDYISLLHRFYDEFEPKVKEAFTNMEKKPAEETGEMCPKCGNPLVIKKSKYGEFVACSNYPECKYIKQPEKEAPKEIMPCPKCNGTIIEKKSRKGKLFYGCNNYPKCDFATWDEPINEFCPECKSILTKKGNKIKCSNCNYEK
jgi:DNA topoisomerase-1